MIFVSVLPPIGMYLERSKVISYTQPVDAVYSVLIIKNPKDSYNYKAYTESLHIVTWMAIGVFCLTCPIILFVANK